MPERPLDEDEVLSLWPEAERAWDRLRAQLDLQAGFWLGYLLCDDQRAVAEMQRRAGRVLRSRSLATQVLAPATPDELVATVAALVAPGSAVFGLTWLAPAYPSAADGLMWDDEAWDGGWRRFLARLNEHRDGLHRALNGGLVISGPVRLAGRVAFLAPDLWTFRSVLVVVGPGDVAGHRLRGARRRNQSLALPITAADPFAWVHEAPLDRRVRPSSTVAELLARAERLGAAGRPADARLAAMEARDRATSDDEIAMAEATLATVVDGIDAAQHALQALALRRPLGAALVALLDVVVESDLDLVRRMQAALASVAVERRRVANFGDIPQNLRDLSISLNRLGNVAREHGHVEDALAAFGESLDLCRGVRAAVGDSPQVLRDLSAALDGVGDVCRELGRWQEALAAYRESLELRRRIREAVGDSPQALRDLSVSLDGVGDVCRELGRWEEATVAYRESLDLCRGVRAAVGDTPQVLRDLSVSLNRVGDVAREQGRLDEALAAFWESLDLRRRVRQAVGDTPGALRDLSVSLDRVGDISEQQGRLDEALGAYSESLDLRRRIREAVGDTPKALRDLAVSLGGIGAFSRERGRLDEALAAYRESLDLRRQVRDAVGETPQAWRDVSLSLEGVGDVHMQQGGLDEALAAYRESLDLARRLREAVDATHAIGDTFQAWRGLSELLVKIGDIQGRQGRPAEALAAYRESLDLARHLREVLGDTPQVLRELSLSLSNMGDALRHEGRLDEALAAYRESLDLARRLQEVLGDTAQALRAQESVQRRIDAMAERPGTAAS